jgi:CarboxypepD_reg-like domain
MEKNNYLLNLDLMKKLLHLIFVILFLNSFYSFSQIIKGRITDSESGQPIVGAIVILTSEIPNKSSEADNNGYFKIENVNVGRHSLKITCIGYENAIINELLINSGKELELNIKLIEQVKQLNEVVIKVQKEFGTSNNDMATVSSRSFSVEQTKRYPASWNDPARMALSFAGTTSVNDESNEIVIRGNSPKGMLWRMEGVEIPNPNHFANVGASGGGISALSVNILSNSDFFTSAFPAEYGNATSGVFDLKMRNGNGDKHETSIQAGFQGLEASTEGPFSSKSKASYLVNYRYSTLYILDKLGLFSIGDASLNYQDVAFKVFVPFKKLTLSLWGLGGFNSSGSNPNVNYTSKESSNFYASGLNILYYVNTKSYWENIFSSSRNQNLNKYSEPSTVFYNQNYSYNYLRYATLYNYKINAQHTLRIGGVVSQINYDILNNGRYFNNNKPINYTNIDDQNGTQLMQAYGQWKFRISQFFTLNTGLHFTYFALNIDESIEPRVGLKWQMTTKSSLSFGAGIHSRIEAVSIYLQKTTQIIGRDTTFLQINKNLQIPKSSHVVLGYEYRPNKDWRINTEVYFQFQSKAGIPYYNGNEGSFNRVYSTLNNLDAQQNFTLQSTGIGKSYGFELTIERYLNNGFFLLSTSSLYNATYKGKDEIERNSRFNGNFVQNIISGKEWKVGKTKKNILSLNLKVTWAGGLRVIPINLPASIKAGSQISDYTHIYEEQLPDFFRTDIRFGYVKNRRKTTHTTSLDMNNITNQQNPRSIYYNNATKSIGTFYQLGLIPILSYQIEF